MNQPVLDIRLKSVLFPLRNYRVHYNQSIRLGKHQIIGLFGTCGCGKSTVCKVAAAIIPFEEKAEIEGSIAWNFSEATYNIEQITNPSDIYRNIGYVNQNPEKNFICEYVIDELVFNMEMRGYSQEYIFQRINYVLEKYNVKHLVHKQTTQLSGGEKQLICVLSSILHAPELLILDEPTAQLDTYWTDCISDHLCSLVKSEDLGILVSSHKSNFLDSINAEIISLTGHENEKNHISKSIIFDRKKTVDNPIVSVSGLDIWRNNRQVITNVSFELFPGDSVLLLGKNGAGKSTLLEAIAKLLKAKSGIVKYLHGKKNIYPRLLQLVFQNPDHQIFTDSVESELKLGFRTGSYSDQERNERLSIFMKHLQFLDHRLDVDPRQLSWGQKKIINILISFCLIDFKNSVLLLDEPDLALDTNQIFNLTELYISALKSGLTIVTVSHNWEIYQNLYNRVFIIEDNHLVELEVPFYNLN